MWAARESVPAHKEESVLRSTTPSVERMEEHTATPVRLGKEMLSAQGSAPANQVYKSMLVGCWQEVGAFTTLSKTCLIGYFQHPYTALES